jgi:FAD:protein FMN transferase
VGILALKPELRRFSRRTFLSLPFLAPLSALWVLPAPLRRTAHRFAYEGVMGTSLDLAVWTPDRSAALRAERVVLDEIDRLVTILSTYDPHSEISRYVCGGCVGARSAELHDVLRSYDDWEGRTAGTISCRIANPSNLQNRANLSNPLNVDALGKAYVIDRAVAVTRAAVPTLDGLLLNVGGDIVAWGRPCEISLADPLAPYDNGRPLTHLMLADGAVATSGTYARGAHIIDPRSGRPVETVLSATVRARDCVTANALATALAVTGFERGVALVKATPGADALLVGQDRIVYRSAGFSRLERPHAVLAAAAVNWPAGFELSITFMLTGLTNNTGFFGQRRRVRRPYVAVWVEDLSGHLVKVLALWGEAIKYLHDLPSLWTFVGHNIPLLFSVSRATREPGRYSLVWNGLDEAEKPVPAGTYRIVVETNQQDGDYAKQSGTITCGTAPAKLDLKASVNFEDVHVQYGPRTTA